MISGENISNINALSHRQDNLVPYAPDFTPALLGRRVGEEKVLPWLLGYSVQNPTRSELQEEIVENGFFHIKGERNRRDMASHVIQGLRNYGLITTEDEIVRLTDAGQRVYMVEGAEQDRVFAAHILLNCGGLRFVDEIRRFELRGETPSMEDLSFLDRHQTSKSLSTMRAWLSRAGVCPRKGAYSVRQSALADVIGERTELLFGLTATEAEFVFAARLMMIQSGKEEMAAASVVSLAEQRNPDVRFRRKSLGGLLSALENKGLVEMTGRQSGSGGAKLVFKLRWQGIEFGESELRRACSQVDLSIVELKPLTEIRTNLAIGDSYELGRLGEMLGIHACLALGLRNIQWRQRAPHAEIDLLADRTAALSYQRWAVQVKNTGGDLSADRVDREVGVTVGSGVTHILFLTPRARLSRPAHAEIVHRCRLTGLHMFFLDKSTFDQIDSISGMHKALALQAQDLATIKQQEAVRRETR